MANRLVSVDATVLARLLDLFFACEDVRGLGLREWHRLPEPMRLIVTQLEIDLGARCLDGLRAFASQTEVG